MLHTTIAAFSSCGRSAVTRRSATKQAKRRAGPARRTVYPQGAGSDVEALRRQEQLVGRRGCGKLDVLGCPGEDPQDLVVGGVHSGPSFPACPGEVMPGYGIGDVGLKASAYRMARSMCSALKGTNLGRIVGRIWCRDLSAAESPGESRRISPPCPPLGRRWPWSPLWPPPRTPLE